MIGIMLFGCFIMLCLASYIDYYNKKLTPRERKEGIALEIGGD